MAKHVCVEVNESICEEIEEEACTEVTTQKCVEEEKTACTNFVTQECKEEPGEPREEEVCPPSLLPPPRLQIGEVWSEAPNAPDVNKNDQERSSCPTSLLAPPPPPLGQSSKPHRIYEYEGPIKKPLNPFMLWSLEERKKASKLFPNKPNGEISQILGWKWNNMTEVDKRPYVKKFEVAKKCYKNNQKKTTKQPMRALRPTPVCMPTVPTFFNMSNNTGTRGSITNIRPTIHGASQSVRYQSCIITIPIHLNILDSITSCRQQQDIRGRVNDGVSTWVV